MLGSGLNLTRVPFFFPTFATSCDPSVIGASAAPRLNDCRYSRSPLQTVTSVESLRAFTTEMPTPCRPPETWYPLSSPPNLPPACSTVSTVSSELVPVAGWTSVGMPRPSSSTATLPSASTVTVIKDACPAWTSSTPLSNTSHTMWCRPLVLVLPMYIPGRFRTGSRPLRTWMEEAPYASEPPVAAAAAALAAALAAMMSPVLSRGAPPASSSPTAMASRGVTEEEAPREGIDAANGARWRPPGRPSRGRAARRTPHDGVPTPVVTGLEVDAMGAIAAISARPPRSAARRRGPMPRAPPVPPLRASVARCARGALSPVALCDVLTPPQASTCALRFMPSLRNASGEGRDPVAVRL